MLKSNRLLGKEKNIVYFSDYGIVHLQC